MSFDTTSTRDHATTTGGGSATNAPGKRSATAGLSAPQNKPANASGTSASSPTTLHGTGWLAGVLGFGGGEASGECECDEHDKHDKHKHKHKQHHHDDVIEGGGEGVVERDGESEGDADGPHAHPAAIPPAIPPPGKAKHSHLKIHTHTVKPAPDGGGTRRTTVGVGEIVKFTGTKAGTWKASAGPVRQGIKSDFFFWEAMDRPGEVLISLKAGNTTTTEVIQVIAPSTLQMVKFSEDHFKNGSQGAGMRTNVTIGPTSVCFGAVEWLEVPGGPSSISGYWSQHQPPNHHPNPQWLPWNDHNTGLTDHAALWGYNDKPWFPGGFTWYVPNKYRVNGKGGGEVFIHTHQVFHITDKKGTTTITKGGAGVRRTP